MPHNYFCSLLVGRADHPGSIMMTLERVPESGRALQRHSEYQRTPTLAFQVRRVLQLPSLPVCHGTSNNDFYSLQCKACPGSPLVRSYRALTAVTPSIPCASGHHYATRSKSDTNTEEEEIIWSIFVSSACQPCHHQQCKACPGSWLSRS